MMKVDTYRQYDNEYMNTSDLFAVKNDNQEVGLTFVLRSMTTVQKKIIGLIAKHQLEIPEEKGIKQKDLGELCIEEMVASNAREMKQHLNEAKDHKIVIEKQDDKGYNMYYMPYPSNVLEKVIQGKRAFHEAPSGCLSLDLVEVLLSLLNERLYVAHPEDPAG